MRNLILVAMLAVSMIGCKNDSKENTTSEETSTEIKVEEVVATISGEFLYMADAAVLNTGKEVYAVNIDEQMEALNKQVQPYKKSDYDFVPVTIKGIILPKPEGEEGWKNRVTIKEILSVSAPSANNDVITINSTKE